MNVQDKKGASFIEIVSVIGSILIFLGVLWLIAINWHGIPSFLKIFVLVVSTIGALFLGVFLRHKEHERVGGALIMLGALLYIASIFLIAQIFSTDATIQGMAWLLLLAWIGVILIAYSLDSASNIFVGLVTFLAWFSAQFIALVERSGNFTMGVFAFGFLAIGILLYALSLIHKSFGHHFSKVYQFWMTFYFLSIFYLLSFQILLPLFWEGEILFNGYLFFILFLGTLALLLLAIGAIISLKKKVVSGGELFLFVGTAFVISLLLLATTFIGEGASIFGGGLSVFSAGWFLWVFINMLFIGFILLVIAYGKDIESEAIVNLAIGFFSLEIITRYIGFIGGIGNLAIFFIVGGILLLVLGWILSKWRKDLVEDIHNKEHKAVVTKGKSS